MLPVILTCFRWWHVCRKFTNTPNLRLCSYAQYSNL